MYVSTLLWMAGALIVVLLVAVAVAHSILRARTGPDGPSAPVTHILLAMSGAMGQALRRMFVIPEWITLVLACAGFSAEGALVAALAPQLAEAATGSAAWLLERRVFGLYCVVAGGLVIAARALATRRHPARFRVASIGGWLLVVLGLNMNIGVPLVAISPGALPRNDGGQSCGVGCDRRPRCRGPVAVSAPSKARAARAPVETRAGGDLQDVVA